MASTEHEIQELEQLKLKVAHLKSELQERSTEVDLLHQIIRASGSSMGLQDLLDFIAHLAAEAIGSDVAAIYLANPDKQELVLSAINDDNIGSVGVVKIPNGEGITGWVARTGEPVVLEKDASQDPRYKQFPLLKDHDFHSLLSVPMISRDEVVGVINARTRESCVYTKRQVRHLLTIAEQAAVVIEGAQVKEAMRRRASEISAISEVSKTVTSNLYLEEILQLIVAVTAKSLHFKICSIMLLDPERNELVIKATQSKNPAYLKKPNIKVGDGIAGRVVQEGKPIVILDVTEAPYHHYPDIAEQEGLRSLVSVPLCSKDEIIGVLNCYTDRPRNFTEDEMALLVSVANQATLAIVNAKLMVKSAIIQEMHHRVKNNLQTIASLLRLQVHHHKQGPVVEALQDSINRILSIAAVHDILSREDLDLISINQVASTILEHARQLLHPSKQIEMSASGPEILLPSSKATSMALILNELVQNAIEHGFQARKHGIINITFARQAGRILVQVTNNGAHLPENFEERANQSLGLQIVRSLVAGELGGKFAIRSYRALTRVAIDFREQ